MKAVVPMPRSNSILLIFLGLMLALWGCSEAPEPAAKQEEAPPVPVEGQTAFFRMFVAARGWAPDALGLRMDSVAIPEVAAQGAKYPVWRARFVSPSKGRVAVFNYSVIELGGKLQKGVFQDHEESYSPGRAKPWPSPALKISTEKALDVARAQPQAKAYVKKNPDEPVIFVLEQTNRHANLTWRVVWGERVSTSELFVFVDASTGEFVEVMH